MAEAHIENGITAQAVLAGVSGLARDVVINTFHFNKIPGGRPSDADLDALATCIQHLYNSENLALPPISRNISRRVTRAENACSVKLYRLDDPVPRQPHTVPFTMGPFVSGTDTGLPPEVAVCLSYKCATKPGPRGRGRIYIGPLIQAVTSYDTPGSYRVEASFQQALVTAGSRLRDESGAASLPWQVYSTMDTVQRMHTITSVWCDNEFDTVRARGIRATTRVTG